jgi:hypothetical protein
MDFTPLLPNAGPTGGEGDAWPAPTMSLTIWSFARALRAILCYWYMAGSPPSYATCGSRRSSAPQLPKAALGGVGT